MVGAILAPSPIQIPSFEGKLVRYNSYHELAYLHKNRFSPDPSVLKLMGIQEGEIFFVLRLLCLISVIYFQTQK